MGVYLKRGDRLPLLRAALIGADGVAIDLTGATVVFRMRDRATGLLKVNAAASVVSPLSGVVQYSWGPTDTDTEGVYDGEFVVTIGGLSETVPGSGYVLVMVEAVLS